MLDAILGFTGLGAGTIRGVQEATGHHPGDHGDGIPTNPDGTSIPVPAASTTMPSSGSTMPPGASPATAEPTPQTVTREA
jgi:hypothetical protein